MLTRVLTKGVLVIERRDAAGGQVVEPFTEPGEPARDGCHVVASEVGRGVRSQPWLALPVLDDRAEDRAVGAPQTSAGLGGVPDTLGGWTPPPASPPASPAPSSPRTNPGSSGPAASPPYCHRPPLDRKSTRLNSS